MGSENFFDIDEIIKMLLLPPKEIKLKNEDIIKILVRVTDVFLSEPTLIEVNGPTIVVGSFSNCFLT